MVINLNYVVKKFEELDVSTFYAIVKERIAVFVVEQNCPYQEIDEVDAQSFHTYIENEQHEILAYTRVYVENQIVHFGRVLVTQKHRGKGFGKEIVAHTLNFINTMFPTQTIQIGAQAHLQHFYQSFGFKQISDIYLEDDIPHVDMEKVVK